MKRALIAATAYFLALFALGFALGTMRVLFAAPRIGPLGATLLEVPVMLAAAFFACRWTVGRWQVPTALAVRGAMALWFLVLLALLETLVGIVLFGQTLAGTWVGLATPAGQFGVSAQIITAVLPLVVGRNERR
ncbi:MAG: hypothetical protein Q8R81_15600 [Novosphingobium sp.]|uniref:hypothetical protein n=1 Tax=Novosphingobium sp. TaxID=1874826 RepID=UPI0027325F43|nr:hypothetical protein [Novosphingobium sp.]MDP3551804.1 hypothetical protein [Novosphingobium sp.]